MADLTKILDKQYESMDPHQLVDAPVDALQGLSKGDADALTKALGIKTIGDMGRNKFFHWAAAIVAMAEKK